MGVVTGRIIKIEDLSQGVHVKNRLTIRSFESGLVFIEFRGAMKKISDFYVENENVFVRYHYDGKTSKSKGIPYNNLRGISIKSV